MNEENGFSLNVSDIKNWQKVIKVCVFLVYAAGGLFATIMFTQAIDTIFPRDNWMNLLAHAGAWANLASVLLMVWAKDFWVAGRGMMAVAVIGWAIEVSMMGLNTLAAFDSSWAGWWTQLAPATPVFVLFLWGVLWLLHPDHKARQDTMNFYYDSQRDFQSKLRRSMKSAKIQKIMDDGAALAAQQFAERSLNVVIDPTYSSGKPPITTEIEQIQNDTISSVIRQNGNKKPEDVNPTKR